MSLSRKLLALFFALWLPFSAVAAAMMPLCVHESAKQMHAAHADEQGCEQHNGCPDQADAEEEEKDPRAELVKRLLEYRKFKEAATELSHMASKQKHFFARISLDKDKVLQLSLNSFVLSLRSMFLRKQD